MERLFNLFCKTVLVLVMFLSVLLVYLQADEAGVQELYFADVTITPRQRIGLVYSTDDLNRIKVTVKTAGLERNLNVYLNFIIQKEDGSEERYSISHSLQRIRGTVRYYEGVSTLGELYRVDVRYALEGMDTIVAVEAEIGGISANLPVENSDYELSDEREDVLDLYFWHDDPEGINRTVLAHLNSDINVFSEDPLKLMAVVSEGSDRTLEVAAHAFYKDGSERFFPLILTRRNKSIYSINLNDAGEELRQYWISEENEDAPIEFLLVNYGIKFAGLLILSDYNRDFGISDRIRENKLPSDIGHLINEEIPEDYARFINPGGSDDSNDSVPLPDPPVIELPYEEYNGDEYKIYVKYYSAGERCKLVVAIEDELDWGDSAILNFTVREGDMIIDQEKISIEGKWLYDGHHSVEIPVAQEKQVSISELDIPMAYAMQSITNALINGTKSVLCKLLINCAINYGLVLEPEDRLEYTDSLNTRDTLNILLRLFILYLNDRLYRTSISNNELNISDGSRILITYSSKNGGSQIRAQGTTASVPTLKAYDSAIETIKRGLPFFLWFSGSSDDLNKFSVAYEFTVPRDDLIYPATYPYEHPLQKYTFCLLFVDKNQNYLPDVDERYRIVPLINTLDEDSYFQGPFGYWYNMAKDGAGRDYLYLIEQEEDINIIEGVDSRYIDDLPISINDSIVAIVINNLLDNFSRIDVINEAMDILVRDTYKMYSERWFYEQRITTEDMDRTKMIINPDDERLAPLKSLIENMVSGIKNKLHEQYDNLLYINIYNATGEGSFDADSLKKEYVISIVSSELDILHRRSEISGSTRERIKDFLGVDSTPRERRIGRGKVIKKIRNAIVGVIRRILESTGRRDGAGRESLRDNIKEYINEELIGKNDERQRREERITRRRSRQEDREDRMNERKQKREERWADRGNRRIGKIDRDEERAKRQRERRDRREDRRDNRGRR